MANGPRKACTSCGLELPLDAFNRNPTGAHGRHSQCKACKNSRATAAVDIAPVARPTAVR